VLSRLGRFCHRRRKVVLLAWIAVLVVAGAASGAIGSGFRSEFTLPDVESARGFDILDERFGGAGSGQAASVVFTAEQGVTDPAVQDAMVGFLAWVEELPGVEVGSPYDPQGQGQIAPGGTIAYATLELPRNVSLEEAAALAGEMSARLDQLEPRVEGLQVELGGQILAEFHPPEAEILGLAFAIIILILAFGSVLAMGLPIGTALFGIGIGAALVTMLSQVLDMPDFTLILGVMIGLGVGIDYALFIVTRYRENVHAGMEAETATAVAINTAGRAVLFAGTTVVISLLGMLLMGVGFVNGLGIGAAVTVAMTMAASVTLLPALLGFAGERVEVTRYRGLIAAGLVSLSLVGYATRTGLHYVALPLALVVLLAGFVVPVLRRELPPRRPKPAERTLAYRWSRLIQRYPWPAAVGGTLLLVVLALPVLSLRLGFADEGNFPADSTTRQAYDLVAEGFGPGYNGPIVVATELPGGVADLAVVERITSALQATPGVAFTSPGVPNDPANPSAALWRIIPTTSPQDAATTELVRDLRREVLPAAIGDAGLRPAVTGMVAVNVDFSDYLGDRLPVFFGVVLALSFLLLMAVFRSVLVPLKAVVMNLISIGAAYGVVVAVFQWGWLKDLVGVGQGGPIEPFVPMMMFAIVFGLSMDYEVFLLSRVKEEYDRTRDNARAVADGLASTARVITAAAAIMVFIFGSFLLETDRVIKLFGIGLASAVFLDATVVRMLLVPATMELLGDRNWWLPRWLDRILPTIDVEGHGAGPAEPPRSETDEPGTGEPESGEPVPVPI
jgi:putative drug exporter of the RND superfamily